MGQVNGGPINTGEVTFNRRNRTADQQMAAISLGTNGVPAANSITHEITPLGNKVTILSNNALETFYKHRHRFRGRATIILEDRTPTGDPDYFRVEFTPEPWEPNPNPNPVEYPPPVPGLICEGEVKGGDILVTDKAVLFITSARMACPKELEVATIGLDYTGVRSVALSMRIDRQTIALGAYSLPPGEDALTINLEQRGVPRFATNKKLTITARLTPADRSSARTHSHDMVILLPVVLVPGIDFSDPGAYGGEGTWPELEVFLREQSEALVLSQGPSGEGYMLDGDVARGWTNYPTLYTLQYDRNNASLVEGADRLKVLIAEIKDKTYAAKVHIVAHSKGGLVSRWYVVDNPLPLSVNRLMLCTVPNVGSVWAVVGGPTGLVDPAGLFPPFPYDYTNLYPLWPWVRDDEREPFISPPNLELAALNDRRLPSGITYTIFYSGNWPTPVSFTRSPSVAGTEIGLAPGDFIVPAFSQLGEIVRLVAPSVPIRIGLIPAFVGVPIERVNISGIHTSYTAANPDVHQAIFSRLTSDLR